MSEQVADRSVESYIRPSAIARILGWSRPNLWYWLNKCQIEMVEYAGYKMVPLDELPAIIMKLRAAKEAAHARREEIDG